MKKAFGFLAALGLFGAAPALAQDATDIQPRDMTEPVEDINNYDVAATAGVGGYLGGLSDLTGVGPVWGVNLNGDLSRGFGWEVGYSGARTPITDERVSDDSAVWRNGVHAMAKVFVPSEMTLRPFAGLGLGGSYLNVSDGAEGLYRNDFAAELPVAAGVEYEMGNLTAGARAMYRFMAGEEFANTAVGGEPEGGLLTGQLTIGGSF